MDPAAYIFEKVACSNCVTNPVEGYESNASITVHAKFNDRSKLTFEVFNVQVLVKVVSIGRETDFEPGSTAAVVALTRRNTNFRGELCSLKEKCLVNT